jgi:hypothetical protein
MLKCKAEDCTYNSHKTCDANVIHVGNTRAETYCDTYTRQEDGKKAVVRGGRTDVEFGAEPKSSPAISCTVSRCVFNKAFRCGAGAVEIDDSHDSNICNCNTYRSK